MALNAGRDADFIKKNGGLDTEADYGYWGLGTFCNPLREGRCCPASINLHTAATNSMFQTKAALACKPYLLIACRLSAAAASAPVSCLLHA